MERLQRVFTLLDVQYSAGWTNGGNHAKPPLVFLHDALGSASQWKDFPERLCALTGRRGFLFDRQGSGGSSPLTEKRTPRYLHDQALEVLPRVLDAAGIEKAAFFGHSDGGTIALLFATAFPGRAEAVISESAHVFVDETTLKGIRSTVERYTKTDFRERLARYHREKTEALFAAWHETWLAEEFRNWNITGELRFLKSPVLVIQGEEDDFGTPEQATSIQYAVGGVCQTVFIPSCGHFPHHEKRESVVSTACEFLKEISREKA